MYSYIQYIQSLRLEHEQNPLLVIHQEACRKIVKQKIIEIFAAFLRILLMQEFISSSGYYNISRHTYYQKCRLSRKSAIFFFFFFLKYMYLFSEVRLMLQLPYFRWIAILYFFFFRLLDRFSLLFTYNMKMVPYFHSINFWCGPSLLSKWSITYILLNFTTLY